MARRLASWRIVPVYRPSPAAALSSQRAPSSIYRSSIAVLFRRPYRLILRSGFLARAAAVAKPAQAVAGNLVCIDPHGPTTPFHDVRDHPVPERHCPQPALRREPDEERPLDALQIRPMRSCACPRRMRLRHTPGDDAQLATRTPAARG